MGKNISSALKFREYIVKEVNFKLNDSFSNRADVPIRFGIEKKIEAIDNRMNVALEVVVFPEAVLNDYPFEIKVKIFGIFETIGGQLTEKFETNAIAILYPYVRAIISTYTAQANVPALILPPINVNSLMKDEKLK